MPCLDAPPLDVVVFLLDDARADQLEQLPASRSRLGGVTFERAYVTVPLCCPERASFLAGGWSPDQTGVLFNEGDQGGFAAFWDERTLPLRLQEQGYRTALFGKYLNGYEDAAPYVPPGWTSFQAIPGDEGWQDFDYVVGSSTSAATEGSLAHWKGYVTEQQSTAAAAFVKAWPGDPLFLYVAFRAPHDPHVPHALDRGSYTASLPRSAAWQEADVSDKPGWVRALPLWTEAEIAAEDATNAERQETLAAVDRAMVAVLDALAAAGRAPLVVLTSDNGLLWGEHRLRDKGVPYEESVRVPLVIAHPSLPTRTDPRLVAANLDLAALVQDVAGLTVEGQGRSLWAPLCDAAATHRPGVVTQSWSDAGMPVWSAWITPTEKVVAYATGETELYDLAADPAETESLHADADRAASLLDALAAERGFALAAGALPDGAAGSPYTFVFETWGGAATWSMDRGQLPPSFVLSADGVLTGEPPSSGTFSFTVTATAVEPSAWSGLPRSHTRGFTLVVGERVPGPGCGCATGAGPGPLLAALLLLRRTRRVGAG